MSLSSKPRRCVWLNRFDDEDRPPRRRALGRTSARCLLALVGLAGAATPAIADVGPQTINGVPQQVVPTYQETGVPSFSVQPGQATSPLAGTTGGSGSGGTDAGGDSQALGTMLRNYTMRKNPPPRATRLPRKKGE